MSAAPLLVRVNVPLPGHTRAFYGGTPEHDKKSARTLAAELAIWYTCRRVVMGGAKPAEVAAELSMSVNAVLLAKSRVLRRARREIAGLID
ncbi:MAG TPA: hypothetical protein VMF69_19455 [Gemmataceae bacterium]|nr:hypothetical protein [Gemmataceae bacterium]